MPNVNRVKRSLFRGGELQECLTPTCSQGFEVPAVEVVGAVDGTQDGFESGGDPVDGVNAAGKNRPLELNPTGRQLTSADLQQEQQVQGAQGVSSARAQQASRTESPYQGAFWKDSQDYSVSNAQSSARSVSEPQQLDGVSENERVDQASQAYAAEMESRRYAELAEQPFSLLGRAELRA
jgi:hypothetical protein